MELPESFFSLENYLDILFFADVGKTLIHMGVHRNLVGRMSVIQNSWKKDAFTKFL